MRCIHTAAPLRPTASRAARPAAAATGEGRYRQLEVSAAGRELPTAAHIATHTGQPAAGRRGRAAGARVDTALLGPLVGPCSWPFCSAQRLQVIGNRRNPWVSLRQVGRRRCRRRRHRRPASCALCPPTCWRAPNPPARSVVQPVDGGWQGGSGGGEAVAGGGGTRSHRLPSAAGAASTTARPLAALAGGPNHGECGSARLRNWSMNLLCVRRHGCVCRHDG